MLASLCSTLGVWSATRSSPGGASMAVPAGPSGLVDTELLSLEEPEPVEREQRLLGALGDLLRAGPLAPPWE
eukprot:16006708-Heterocapsa_arctica.AAC.1